MHAARPAGGKSVCISVYNGDMLDEMCDHAGWNVLYCTHLVAKSSVSQIHIANGIVISWIMTCCVLPVMSPASNQIAEVGQNTPAKTNNFDMQLGARTKDWEDTTVAMEHLKCGKSRNMLPVEGKTMAAAATSATGKTPMRVDNVQEAVVKALATQAPAAAAFAGMHEFESGNGFGLGELTAFGAIAEGETAYEASNGGMGTGEDHNNRPHRVFKQAATILKCLHWLRVAMEIMMVLAQLGKKVTLNGYHSVTFVCGNYASEKYIEIHMLSNFAQHIKFRTQHIIVLHSLDNI